MIKDIQDFHTWSYEKIAANEKQVKKLGDQKCEEIKLWLDTLASNNLALEMIEFLTKAIESADATDFVSQTNFL